MRWNTEKRTALQEEQLTPAQKQWQTERRGGNYGVGTKEMQARNYVNRKETEQKRRELFDVALSKFRKNDIQGVRSCRRQRQTKASRPCSQQPGMAWSGSPASLVCLYLAGEQCSAESRERLHARHRTRAYNTCDGISPCRPCKILRRSSAWSPKTTWEMTSHGSHRSTG